MNSEIFEKLDLMVPNPKCELDYEKDYELLIATMLSAQTTDKRVNIVTKELFKYSLYELSIMENKKLEEIIKSLGTYTKKASYVKNIAKRLLIDYNGEVPQNREYLESLPGVGRKTTNVVFSHLFNIPAIAVDTHVLRTSKILGLVRSNKTPEHVEKILMKKVPKEKCNRVASQLVLFGRYICKAKKPDCKSCLFNKTCKYKKTDN